MNNLKMFMPEVSEQERISILQTNADKIEKAFYQKNLTEDEKLERKETLYKNSLELSDLKEQKKKTDADFKEKIDPLKEDNQLILNELRTGQVAVSGNLYLIANHQSGQMESFDSKGELIASRRLFPDEKQLRMNSLTAVK